MAAAAGRAGNVAQVAVVVLGGYAELNAADARHGEPRADWQIGAKKVGDHPPKKFQDLDTDYPYCCQDAGQNDAYDFVLLTERRMAEVVRPFYTLENPKQQFSQADDHCRGRRAG